MKNSATLSEANTTVFSFIGRSLAHKADAKMAVEYRASTVSNMDMEDSKVGYKQFFGEGSKVQYSGKKIRASFQIGWVM